MVIEAMKMEMEITSPSHGVVLDITFFAISGREQLSCTDSGMF